MKRVSFEAAFVLHRRPYRESSFLVELFTKEYGRLTVIAKGVRKARSSHQGLLQPFVPLSVSWVGRGELMTLSDVEVRGEIKSLRGECLFAGFYLNELIMGLLERWDAHPALYTAYEKTISALQRDSLEQKALRIFEKRLLEELGYGILPKEEGSSESSFSPEKYYRFTPDQGFVISELGDHVQAKSTIFSGDSLMAIAREDWQNDTVLQDAKRLTRLVLMPLLGAKTLHSRKLFMQPIEENENE